MVSQNKLRTHEGNKVFSYEKKIRFVTALDLIACFGQIKYQRLLITCAHIPELPSNINSISNIMQENL